MQYPSRISTASIKGKQSTGFTLIEVLIAIVVVSILTSIAYPAYSQYSTRSKIAEGIAELSNIRLVFEQQYQDTRSYLKDGTTDECAVDAPNSQYFTFVCNNVTGTTYTWTAKNKANVGLGNANGYQFSIDHNGNQSTLAFAGNTITKPCWMTSQNSC